MAKATKAKQNEAPYQSVNIPRHSYAKVRAYAKDRGMLIRKVLELSVDLFLKTEEQKNANPSNDSRN